MSARIVTVAQQKGGAGKTTMMKAAREEFASHSAAFTEAELLAIPADAELSVAKVNLEMGEPLP